MCGVTGNLIIKIVKNEAETLHNMRPYLVAETLRSNDCNLIADSLVGLEVEGQLGVVSLNDDLGGLLDGLGTNATHDCGCEGLSKLELSMDVLNFKSDRGCGRNSLTLASADLYLYHVTNATQIRQVSLP